MSNDISIDAAGASIAGVSFEEFYRSNVESLGDALLRAADDPAIAAQALKFAMTRGAQRWRSLTHHPNPVGWVFGQGVEWIRSVTQHSAAEPAALPADALHGLDVAGAFAALPVDQRAVLIAAHSLGWTDEFTAAGFEVDLSTIRTRRQRARWFLGGHLEVEPVLVERAVTDLLADSPHKVSALPDLGLVRRRGRRRELGRALVLIALILVVVGGIAGLVDVRSPGAPESADRLPVDPPTNSPESFAAVSDGRGGFVALDASGGALFVESVDGEEWFRAALWNSRRIDVRTQVTGFERSGGRYVTTLEGPLGLESVPPFVAVSDDLETWQVNKVDEGDESPVAGLRPRATIASVAVVGEAVLVGVMVRTEIDYEALGISPLDVCVEREDSDRRTLHLCDGSEVTIAEDRSRSPSPNRLYLSEQASGLVEVTPPDRFDPYGLFSSRDEFFILDAEVGEIIASRDGQNWRTVYAPEAAGRFGLAIASPLGDLLVVTPAASGWRSSLVTDGEQFEGDLGLDLEPGSVWVKPSLVNGPAGWALFVTTSRPWEQTARTAGWAVDGGEWVVSKLPDSDVITARSTSQDRIYRFLHQPDEAGTIRLAVPGTEEVLVTISEQDIADSLAGAVDEADRVKARLFFSDDGTNWRVLWETSLNTWGGSVAVGDTEVLLTGTELQGEPIVIPLVD